MSKLLHVVFTSSAVFAAASAPGCGAPKAASTAIVDCLAADASKIDALIVDLRSKTKPDGSRDWAAISADAVASGVVIGGCALAEFVESYLAPTRAMLASNAPADGLQARQTLEHFRATEAGGATFKTRLGTQ